MIKKIFALVALLVLAAAPLALAHDGHNNTKDKTVPGPNPHCWPDQNPHDYTTDPGHSTRWKTFVKDGNSWAAVVADHNIEDCDKHDSTKQGPAHIGDFDFDGDYEYGWGGGFFPAGFWANEPICNRGYVDHHHTDVHVHDALWPYDKDDPAISALHNSVGFWVGADPSPPTIVTTPPVVILDPDGIPDSGDEVVIPGSTSCIDDGCICQGELDPDDWLKACLHKCSIFPAPLSKAANPAYGTPGGDGGYWVFVVGCRVETDGGWDGALIRLGTVDEDGDGIPDDTNGDGIPDADPSVADVAPPTTAGATCSTTGHIYFPNIWPGKN